jgi:hypothetical protein
MSTTGILSITKQASTSTNSNTSLLCVLSLQARGISIKAMPMSLVLMDAAGTWVALLQTYAAVTCC